jgi:hypothetical protein
LQKKLQKLQKKLTWDNHLTQKLGFFQLAKESWSILKKIDYIFQKYGSKKSPNGF